MRRYIKTLGLFALAGLVVAGLPGVAAAKPGELVLYTASN